MCLTTGFLSGLFETCSPVVAWWFLGRSKPATSRLQAGAPSAPRTNDFTTGLHSSFPIASLRLGAFASNSSPPSWANDLTQAQSRKEEGIMFGLWHRRPARDSACPPRISRADGARNNQWAGFPGAAPTLPASPQVGIARAFGPENLVSAPTARSIPAWGGVGSADAAPGKRNAKAARAEGPIHARGPDAGPRRSVAQVTGNRFGRVPWARRPCHSGADASPPRCASR